jgi:hypothetical protein
MPVSIRFAFVLGFMLLFGFAGSAVSQTITPGVALNRTSGVAPLAIFFDATETNHSSVTVNEFHDLHYRWDFGDSEAGKWTLRPNGS